MCLTFAGSFSTKGKEGNSFLFPGFKAKIQFPDDQSRINLFAFNPKFVVSLIVKLECMEINKNILHSTVLRRVL